LSFFSCDDPDQTKHDIESVSIYYFTFGINEGVQPMNDVRLLQNFLAVYRHRSFRTAADELGVAQSSVSKRIALLEGHLGMRLFNRTTRAVEPTDTARQLISHAENAVQANSAFSEEARLLAGGELGRIRVGAIALAAETLMVDGMVRLAHEHPNLDVEVVVGSSDVYRDLATGECDVVVGDEANFETSTHASRLRMERIHDEKLVYVHRADHPAAGAKKLAELLSYPIAIPSRYFNENRLFKTMSTQTNPPTHPRYRLNSLSACIALAANSDVVSLAPRSLVTRMAHQDRQPAIVPADFDTGIEFSMVLATVARNAPTPAVRAFGAAIASAEFR
jgi:DNA-binding transcriptional LysR family regulator